MGKGGGGPATEPLGGEGGGWRVHLARALERGPGAPTFALLSALLSLLFFGEFVLWPDRMLFGTDMLDQGLQLRSFGVEEVRAGRGLPLWNPFVYGGLPYLGVLPGPVFYPTSLLYLVLPLARAIGWTFVLHVGLAGLLAYAAGRSFGLDRWAAAATGLSFMFAGYFLSTLYGGQDGRMFAMALVPAVFACVERGFEEGRLRWFLLMGLAVALQIVTPHVQVMYFSSLAVSLYALWRLTTSGHRGAHLGRRAGFFALGFLVAAALGSAQLLPAADLLRYGVRGAGQGGYEFAASWALPPQELTTLFLPDLVGSLRESYWGSNPFKLHTEYLGVGVLGLAILGWLHPRGDRRVWFLAGATLLGIAFALGGATPVHRVAYLLVPLVDRFRAPAMMLGPVSFLVALAAGFGVQRLLEVRRGEDRPLSWPAVAAVVAPFVLFSLWAALAPGGLLRWTLTAWYPVGWPRHPPPGLESTLRTTGLFGLVVWGVVLGGSMAIARGRLPRAALALILPVLVADLWRVDARYNRTVEIAAVTRAGSLVREMGERLAPGERVWALEETFGPNELLFHRVPTVTGRLNFRLAWYDRLVGGVEMGRLLRNPSVWPLFDLRFLAVRSRVTSPLLREVRREGGVGLFELATDPPHAFFPREVERADTPEEAVRRTLALRDARLLAVVEPGVGTGGATGQEEGVDVRRGEGPLPVAGSGTARLTVWEPDRLELDVRADRAGLLFVSEIWHPAWRATVDGRTTRVLRVNGAFRGVEVPEGRHRVVLSYRPAAARAGMVISAGSLLLVLGLLGGGAARELRSRQPDDAPTGSSGPPDPPPPTGASKRRDPDDGPPA